MAQLMPLALTVSCFSKIQIGFAILVSAHPGSPGKRAVKRVCVCVCVCVCLCVQLVLAEVLGHEFHVTLHSTQSVADVSNMHGYLYAFDISSTSPRENDSATVPPDDATAAQCISIVALCCDTKKSRRFWQSSSFTARSCASSVRTSREPVSVCVCVCHKSVFYRNR